MVMQLAAQFLEDVFKKNNAKPLKENVSSADDIAIRKHTTFQVLKLSCLEFVILLHMDYGALIFVTRRDTIRRPQLFINVLTKFGLIVHTEKGDKISKTKAVFFPNTTTIRRWSQIVNAEGMTIAIKETTYSLAKSSVTKVDLLERTIMLQILSNLQSIKMKKSPFWTSFSISGRC